MIQELKEFLSNTHEDFVLMLSYNRFKNKIKEKLKNKFK